MILGSDRAALYAATFVSRRIVEYDADALHTCWPCQQGRGLLIGDSSLSGSTDRKANQSRVGNAESRLDGGIARLEIARCLAEHSGKHWRGRGRRVAIGCPAGGGIYRLDLETKGASWVKQAASLLFGDSGTGRWREFCFALSFPQRSLKVQIIQP